MTHFDTFYASIRVRMTGLLGSCLKQVDIVYRNIISVRCSSIMAKNSCNMMIMIRFQDSKISAGRLKFFVNLCTKLKIDIDKFMAIVDQNRVDTLDRLEQVTINHLSTANKNHRQLSPTNKDRKSWPLKF